MTTANTNRTYIATEIANKYILLEAEPTWCAFRAGAEIPYDEGRTDCEDYRDNDPEDVSLVFGFVSSGEAGFCRVDPDEVVEDAEIIDRLNAAVDGKDEDAIVTTPRWSDESYVALSIEL